MADMQFREDFKNFRVECSWLSMTYEVYRDLFENGAELSESGAETEKILQDSAPEFFKHLNATLIDSFFLQACRLTDRAGKGSKVNLTSQYIDEHLCRKCLMTPGIMQHSCALLRFRKVLLPARNQIIAHADRKTIREAKSLGEHTKGEATAFLQSLQSYCDAVGSAIGVRSLNFVSIPIGSGDAFDLLKVLKRGLECGTRAQDH